MELKELHKEIFDAPVNIYTFEEENQKVIDELNSNN